MVTFVLVLVVVAVATDSRAPRGIAAMAIGVTQAKAICARCPVRRQCLVFALNTRQNHGVWGGMTEEECRPRAEETRTA